LLGTGFVVKRQGDRAWIATALHVVLASDDRRPATKVEAELYTGPLPEGLEPPRLVVTPPVSQGPGEGGDDLIILEVRGLPPDVQPLPLSAAQPAGADMLKVVGHYPRETPWNVVPVTYLGALTEAASKELKFAGVLDSGASGSPVLSASGEVMAIVRTSMDVDGVKTKVISAYRALLLREKMP
ncbi:MAG: serine protease, partial [Cyanobium sp.]